MSQSSFTRRHSVSVMTTVGTSFVIFRFLSMTWRMVPIRTVLTTGPTRCSARSCSGRFAASHRTLEYAHQHYHTRTRSSTNTQKVLNQTVAGVRQVVPDNGVLTEGLVPSVPTADENESQSSNEYKKEKAQKTLTLARKHVIPTLQLVIDKAIARPVSPTCWYRGSYPRNSSGQLRRQSPPGLYTTCSKVPLLRCQR